MLLFSCSRYKKSRTAKSDNRGGKFHGEVGKAMDEDEGIGVAHLHHRFAVVIFPEVIEMIRVDLERLAWGRMSKAGDR